MPDTRPSIRQLISKGGARVRARGPLEVMSLGLRRSSEMIASSGRLVVLVRATDAQPIGPREDLLFGRATPHDAEAYARDIGTDSASTFRTRLTATTRCYLVRDSGILVHATWCTTNAAWTREIRAYLVPPSGDAYVYESYTRPEARGRGVYPFALSAIAADLSAEGIARVWVAVEADNAASLKAVATASFEPHSEIAFTRRWGRITIHPGTGPEGTGGLEIRGAR
jgi:ribosomal protein S18 acetylase RimI-like enzyme